MSNELANLNLGGGVDIQSLAAATQEASIVGNYLKMLKGVWSCNKEELGADDMFVPVLSSFKKGWVERIRTTGEPIYGAKIMGFATNAPKSEDLIPTLNPSAPGYEVVPVYLMEFACVKGEYEGEILIYEVNSKGGVNAIGHLIDTVYRFSQGNGGNVGLPVFKLKYSKGGETYYPLLETQYWDDTELTETRRRMNEVQSNHNLIAEEHIADAEIAKDEMERTAPEPTTRRKRRT